MILDRTVNRLAADALYHLVGVAQLLCFKIGLEAVVCFKGVLHIYKLCELIKEPLVYLCDIVYLVNCDTSSEGFINHKEPLVCTF